MENLKLDKLNSHLSAGLALDQASVDLFSMALEREWETHFRLTLLCYEEDPDLLRVELTSQLKLLKELEDFYIDREEYERCGPCRDLYRELKVKYSKHLR